MPTPTVTTYDANATWTAPAAGRVLFGVLAGSGPGQLTSDEGADRCGSGGGGWEQSAVLTVAAGDQYEIAIAQRSDQSYDDAGSAVVSRLGVPVAGATGGNGYGTPGAPLGYGPVGYSGGAGTEDGGGHAAHPDRDGEWQVEPGYDATTEDTVSTVLGSFVVRSGGGGPRGSDGSDYGGGAGSDFGVRPRPPWRRVWVVFLEDLDPVEVAFTAPALARSFAARTDPRSFAAPGPGREIAAPALVRAFAAPDLARTFIVTDPE